MLQNHCGQHMKNKRYPCWWPKCMKGFSYKCDLRKHIEVHKNKAKPKKCSYCTYMNADSSFGHKKGDMFQRIVNR